MASHRLSDDMALRIGMASRSLPGIELDDWVSILIRAVGLPLTVERVKKLRLKRLRQSGGRQLHGYQDEQLRQALASLRGHGVDMRATLPPTRTYRNGDMPGSIRVACASNRSDRIDAAYGTCARFLIYQVSVQEARLIDIREVTVSGNASVRFEARACLIGDCHVLCALTLGATAAASVVRAGVHPLRVGVPQTADRLLASLQDVMSGSPPPWMDNLMRGSSRPDTSNSTLSGRDDHDEPARHSRHD